MYAINSKGQREVCPHPGELRIAQEITGMLWEEAEARGLVGTHTYCVCLDCLTQCEINMKKDAVECSSCGSKNIVSEIDLVGKKCPKCKVGDFQEIITGIWA